jgi:EAL domain-containing protein (putative c-di-GMP-specific phosphodiesterase class I)
VARRWSSDETVDERAVRTLFQPIVHLGSREVVGFEALSRGPAGSAWEAPEALLGAAARAGRLGELDRVCRTRALRAAAMSGLPRGLTWFVNVEPAGLDPAAPADWTGWGLRTVLEVVERGVGAHLPEVLQAVQRARAGAWGIALDDVGAEEISMALLPVVQPDVVKLDLSLLHGSDPAAAMRTAAAVGAYAERRGAVILAEGIETREQEQLAQVLGAHYGQGYRYGRPGPLPAALPEPRHRIPLRQRPEPPTATTPYETLTAARTPRRAARSELRHISRHLEAAARGADADTLVLCVPEQRRPGAVEQQNYRNLAERSAMTVVVTDRTEQLCGPRLRATPPAAEAALEDEWAVIVLGPHYAAAFAARPCPGEPGAGEGGDAVMEYVFTHDRDLALASGRSLLQGVIGSGAAC